MNERKLLYSLLYKLSLLLLGITLPIFTTGNLVQAQNSSTPQVISGKVVNKSGEPIIGASILVKGTKSGTIADINGEFVLKGNFSNPILHISYVGHKPQDIKVGNGKLKIIMEEDNGQLDEVVVIGYGQVKRANLSGAVSNVKAKELQDFGTKDLASSLAGVMPGVSVSTPSGSPIANSQVKIRITGTWNSDDALYVIDGFVRDVNAFNLLDPTEVEDISILKDAAAVVYGSRASGGVVLVTTKRGKVGKTKVSYSGNFGYNPASKMPNMMSAYEHASTLNALNDAKLGWNPALISQPDNAKLYYTPDELEAFKSLDYNWLDGAWKDASSTRHAITVGGGSEKFKYNISASYDWHNGNFDNLYSNRYNFRAAMDIELAKNLNLGIDASYNNKVTQAPYSKLDTEADRMYGTFGSLLRAPRWTPAYINGKVVGNNSTQNALEMINIGSATNNNSQGTVLSGNLEYSFPKIQGLKLKFSANLSNNSSYNKRIAKNYNRYEFATTGTNGHIITDTPTGNVLKTDNSEGIQESSGTSWNYQIGPSINYNRTFGKHSVSGMIVYEQSENGAKSLAGNRVGLLVDNYPIMAGYLSAGQDMSSTVSNGARESFIGRFNYTFNDKYNIEAQARYEGSSTFHPDDRWGIFPSLSASWVVSRESWFENHVSFIDMLKLRASAGRLGNDKGNLRAWELNYQLSPNTTYLGYGSSLVAGLFPQNNGVITKGITWEKSDNYNIGLDVAFLRDFKLNVDGYYKYTFDILDNPASIYPQSSGIGTSIPKRNFGIAKAWGTDLGIAYEHKINKDLSFKVSGILSWSDNLVVKKFQSAGVVNTWMDENGRRRGGEVGYESFGIARTKEDAQNYVNYLKSHLPNGQGAINVFGKDETALLIPGYIMFKDLRGTTNSNNETPNGVIDDKDQTHITSRDGNPFESSLTFGFKWINFSADIQFTGEFGGQICYEKAFYTTNSGGGRQGEWLSANYNNLEEWYNNSWTPTNIDAKYPKLDGGFKEQRSTFWVRNGDVIRLNNINMSYTFPKSLISKAKIESARMFFNGRNIATLLNPYSYKDPSVSIWSDYPMISSYSIGLNLTF